MLSLKNVKSPDSNFVNFPKVGAYGAGHLAKNIFLTRYGGVAVFQNHRH